MKAQISKIEVQSLVKLGLNRKEAECYTLLLNTGALTAGEIADELNILPNAVYRLTEKLIRSGFVIKLETYPAKFQAIQPDEAISSFTKDLSRAIKRDAENALSLLAKPSKPSTQTTIRMVTGQKQVFDTYVALAKKAHEEILVISIGEPVSDSVKLATRDALARGVSVKFMFHLYNDENKNLLESWVKMGVHVRYSPGWGYHLIVVDGKRSLIVANNPQETKERTGVVIHSNELSKAHKYYFDSLWSEATKIG